MAFEIERKFLVKNDAYKILADSRKVIRQAYLSTLPEATVRVRTVDSRGFLTVKSKNHGAVRHEWEYEIPFNDALEMLEISAVSPVIEKTRYALGRWEVDEFHGSLSGLVIAEIELDDEKEQFLIPDFIGKEVTGNPDYYNSTLSLTGRIPR